MNHPAGKLCCYAKWPQSPSPTHHWPVYLCGMFPWRWFLGRDEWFCRCVTLPRHLLETNLQSFLLQIFSVFKWRTKYHLFRAPVKLTFAAFRFPEKSFIQTPQNFEVLAISMVFVSLANHSTVLVECERQ